jgi:signal transduction histidine kinase
LRPAESLGREALAAGLDSLDLAMIHEEALITLLPPGLSSSKSHETIRRSASFLVATLTPIANAHRTALKNSGRLKQLIVTLRQQLAELAATHRQLKRNSREAAQEALKKSDQHYGQLLDKARRMQEHSRRLSHQILSGQEEERKKISRELHDAIGQTLIAINLRLAKLGTKATVHTTGLKKEIASTRRLVERSMDTVHRFARELRPPQLDDLGLIPALHSYIKGFTKRTRILIHLTAFSAVEQLESDKRTVLYRIAQEALANVAKHAEASSVEVSIQKLQNVVRMEIHDNGKSFQVQRVLFAKRITRLGLLGMRERAEMVGGSFTVESLPGKGTTIRTQIPIGNGR